MKKAFLEITLKIDEVNRSKATAIYTAYKQPFLTTVKGAQSKDLLIREEDVQVLHGFNTTDDASAYLTYPLFTNDVVNGLKPLLTADPEIRIYTVI